MPKLKYIHIPPEKIAEGRRRYEETNELNEDIAAFLGISPSTFKSRRRQWGWRPRHGADAGDGTRRSETRSRRYRVTQTEIRSCISTRLS